MFSDAIKGCINSDFPLFFLFFLQAGFSYNTFMYLAVFHVFPLQIVGIIGINKKVCRLLFWYFNHAFVI